MKSFSSASTLNRGLKSACESHIESPITYLQNNQNNENNTGNKGKKHHKIYYKDDKSIKKNIFLQFFLQLTQKYSTINAWKGFFSS